MNNIEKIIYINLNHRTDRRSQIEEELKKMDLSGERFAAIQTNPGYIGCLQSHVAVLELAKSSGWKNVLILEDDFQFIVDKPTFEQEITKFFQLEIPYDVLMLSYNLIEGAPFNEVIGKVLNVQTTSGYLVHEGFYDALIANFKEALPHLIQTNKHWIYSCDQSWKILQPISKWFYLTKRIGIQCAGFSDIAQQHVNYGGC